MSPKGRGDIIYPRDAYNDQTTNYYKPGKFILFRKPDCFKNISEREEKEWENRENMSGKGSFMKRGNDHRNGDQGYKKQCFV